MAFSSGEKEKALPVELTDQICSYLDAEDLFNLSATNTFWRNAVNRDCIWKPLCVRYFNVNPYGKPLIGRKCRVEPPFETMTNSSQNLSDICAWRIRFAQEIYVLNNWKLRRFHAKDLPDKLHLIRKTHSYFICGNFAIFHAHTNVIEIWKITDDGFSQMEPIVFHRNNIISHFQPLRNGFVLISCPFIYYYVHDEDGFQLKIRTIVTKAFHPEIPLLADLSEIDPSHVKEFNDNPSFYYSIALNERYVVFFDRKDEYILFIIWDLKIFATFSYNLNQSIKGRFDSIFLVEGDSSILYMSFANSEIFGPTIYILKIQNSRIDILNVHDTMKRNFPSVKIVGDSLAMMYFREIVFLAKDGTTRSVRCSEVGNLINCRSFYVGRLNYRHQKVVSIDKKTLSVKVIREGFCVEVISYLKKSSLDLVLISYFDREPYLGPFYDSDCDLQAQEFKDACYKALDADNDEKRELYDLRKSNIISWPNKEYIDALNPICISNSNKIVIAYKNVFHFW